MNQLAKIFDDLARLTQASNFSIRVECDNLETVYLARDADGSFLVSDRHYTFTYLLDNPGNYRNPDEIGIQKIRDICDRHRVELVDVDANIPDAEPCMTILKRIQEDDQVPDGISAVSACIDEIFDIAFKI